MLRLLRGDLSQQDVADATGVPKYTLSDIERGTTAHPAMDTLAKLALFYGITMDEMAAMAGLFPPPEGADDEMLIPEAAKVLRDIRYQMTQLDSPILQAQFTEILQRARDDMRFLLNREQIIASSTLPSYIRRRLQQGLRPMENDETQEKDERVGLR